jgi:GNAT superfamily N-acetyltransferase
LGGRVDVTRFDVAADPEAGRALYEVYRAGAPVDEPDGPAMSARVFGGLLDRGWCAEPRENWLARDGSAVVGGYSLVLPDRENRDRAGLTLLVAPERRRAGIGTALLRHATARAAELGRRTVSSEVLAGTPGDGFARAMGARADLVENRRTLELAAIPAGHLARLRDSALAHADGYTLTSWDGLTPDEWLDPVARLNEALADAPRGAGEQPQVWNSGRVRLADQLSLAKGMRRYSVAAVHVASGELAALTQVSIEDDVPSWGHQEMTAVVRPHRGHRLGLLTKVAMLEWLAEREPQLRSVQTWNGETNAHMVAINEALGYRDPRRVTAWLLPARVPAGAGQP